MKNKFSRFLVMLLAIAMMIPSFAMAEGETFTITPKTDAPKQYYIVDGSTAIAGTDLGTYTVAGLPKDKQSAWIEWTSSNTNVASVMPETPLPADVADQPLPTVTKMGIGEATITGELFVNNVTTDKKATFTVKIEAKALKTFKFKDDAKKQFNLDTVTDVYYDLYDQLLVEADAEGSSYTKDDVEWELTSDSKYATLTLTKENGKVKKATVTFNKDAIEEATTVTVKASIPGTTHEATWTAQVISAREPGGSDPQVKGYDTVAFTAPKVYITKSTLNLLSDRYYMVEVDEDDTWDYCEEVPPVGSGNYRYYQTITQGSLLNLLPADVVPMNDPLTWTGTTPTAQVYVNNKGVVNFGDQYGEVEVTVKSTVNQKEAKITVVRLSPEHEVVPYETLTMDPKEITIRRDETINVNTFLTPEPAQRKIKNDWLVYESTDTSVASVDEYGQVTAKVDEGTVTIKVFSKANSEKAKAELKITYQKAANSKYKSLTFSKTAFDFKINENDNTISFKATDYLTTDPVEKPVNDDLTWTSSDKDVATVNSTTGYVNVCAKAGTATIKVENKDKSAFAAITVNVEVVENPYKAITVSAEAQKGLTVEEKKTIDLKDYLTLELTRSGSNTNDELTIVVDNTKTATVTMPKINKATGAITEGAVLTGVKASDKPVTVTIRNSTGSVKAEIKVTVEKPKTVSYTSLKFDTAELTVPKNFPAINVVERHLIAVKPDDFNDKSGLIWKSSDENVASFADPTDGKLTIKKPGTTEISVRNGENTVKSENVLKITVLDAESYSEVKAVESTVTINVDASQDTVYSLAYNVLAKDGYGDSLVWTSSNQQIATVDNTGKVTVKKSTSLDDVTVTIKARSKLDDSKEAAITLTIKKNVNLIKSIKLTQDTFDLEPSGKLYLGRYVVTDPVDYSGDELFFTSDDPSVAIQLNGDVDGYDVSLVEGNNDKTVHITVRSKNNPDCEPKKFTITLKMVAATSIKFVDAPKNFYPEVVKVNGKDTLKTLDLTDYLVIKPANYNTANLVWESSDPTVAKVNNGVVTYVQAGKVTITATDKIGGQSGNVDLTLGEKNPVKSIALKDITMDVDDGLYVLSDFLTYAPLDADINVDSITWTSSNREIAEVVANADTTGITIKQGNRDKSRGPILVAYKAGTTKITAYYELEDDTVIKATATVTVNEVELEKVKISADKYTLKLNTKTEAVVRFNVEPFNCTFEKEDLYVISADPEIVEVSEIKVDTESHKGKFTITGKKPGTAWVVVKRAKDDKSLDACKVKVKAVAVKSVGWEKKNIKMYYYDDGKDRDPDTVVKVVQATNTVYKNTLDVTPIINPDKAYCKVSFETSDPSVAFINDQSAIDFLTVAEAKSVKLVCLGPGKCKITMKVDDGKKVRKAVMNVEVLTKLPKLKLSEKRATLKLEKGKDTLQLRAYDANTDKDIEVKWASSDTKVAKVNVDGKVRAVGAGTATISATTKNGQKQVVKCKIIVKAPSTKNVAAKKITGDTKVTVKAGEKKALEIKVKPEGAKVTFTSSDTKIVKVTKDGTIKGIKAGKATITVKAAEGKAELKIKVVVK